MEPAFTFQPTNLAVQIASIAIIITAPFIAGAVIRHTLGVGWRIFWMGAITFIVSQMLLRIPLVGALQAALGPHMADSALLSFLVGTLLAFTACSAPMAPANRL
jgi:hypothetical protein